MVAAEQKKINVIDLFAGCGGLTDGFESTGKYNTLACVEWEKPFSSVLKKRLETKWGYEDAQSRVITFDIQRTDELFNGWYEDGKYGTFVGLDKVVAAGKYRDVDIVIGGPPCQAYSIAGRIRDEQGMQNDYRNFLFESYVRVLSHYKPKLFVFENVPGILSAAPGGVPIISRIRGSFFSAGYEIVDDINNNALIDMADYGVPQNRKRVILLGVKTKEVKENIQVALSDFYKRILPSYKEIRKRTVGEVIVDLPKLFPSTKDEVYLGRKYSHKPFFTEISNHAPRFHSRRDIGIFKELALDVFRDEPLYGSIDKIKALYTDKTGRTSSVHKYYVLRLNEPSNTIVAHLYKDGLRHIHPDPDQARSITVREAARLQTFDDDFIFESCMGDQYKMIGNAVPPLFARKLGDAVYNFFCTYVET